MNDFVQAYLESALWTTDDNPGSGEWSEHDEWSIANLAPEALAQAKDECDAFVDSLDDDARAAVEENPPRAGHDFWLTRNHHGCGFWDGDWQEPVASALTKAAHDAGERNLYVGDDGRLYFMEG